MFLTVSVFAQKQIVFISEDFSEDVPPVGWSIDAHSTNWSQKNTNLAGGTAPEARFFYAPHFNGTTRLISPELDLSEYTSLVLSFKHYVDYYSDGFTIGVATSADGGSTWNSVWSVNPTADIGPETQNVMLSGGDLGNDNVKLCFYFIGDSYQIDYWFIDDVELYYANAKDGKISSIDVEEFILNGEVNVSTTVANVGLEDITSVDLCYQIDDGAIISESVTGIDFAMTEFYEFEFAQQWTSTAGDYELKVWLENINGTGDDDDLTNDILTKTIHVATQGVQKVALYEEFTSSTCGPCASFNNSFFNESFYNTNEGKFTLIKYQMSWPSPGDDYYTAEGGVRRSYYGVSGVPTLYIDGSEGTHYNTALLQADLDAQNAKGTFFDIDGVVNFDGTDLTLESTVSSYINAPDFVVYAVVVEKMTTENTGNNGETEFFNVMMKMMPNAYGTDADFTIGGTFTFTETVDMSTTFVEEMYDLEVIVFIQNPVTGEVFQSKNIRQTPSVVFTPGDEETDVAITSDINIVFNNEMRKIDDSEITDANISDIITLTTPDKAILPFTATIDSKKQVINITPDEDFEYFTEITVSLLSIEDTNNVIIADTNITFKTLYLLPTVEFTPEDGAIDVDVSSIVTLIFNKEMRKIDDTELTDANISDIVTLTDLNKANLTYTATIDAAKKVITITPDEDFTYFSNITVTLVDIEDVNDVVLDGTDISFRTETYIQINEDDISNVNIYPNPASSNLHIECEVNSRINIIDVDGKIIFTQLSTNEVNNIDLSTINSGVYYVNISNSEYNETKKLIILK